MYGLSSGSCLSQCPVQIDSRKFVITGSFAVASLISSSVMDLGTEWFTVKQEPCGHPTSASNVEWIIVNYSSIRVS